MPLRKVAQPEDVAAQVVVLASDALSGHVTGQVVVVAGGMEGRLVHADRGADMTDSTGRKAVNAHTTPFLPYDMEGPVQPEHELAPDLSYDERVRPGHVPHAHGARAP